MASDAFTPAVGDEVWYDRRRRPDSDIAYLPTTNRTAYLQASLSLLHPKAFDIRN